MLASLKDSLNVMEHYIMYMLVGGYHLISFSFILHIRTQRYYYKYINKYHSCLIYYIKCIVIVILVY